MNEVLEGIAKALEAATPRLNELDQVVGDGDIGTSLSRGASAAVEAVTASRPSDPASMFRTIGLALQRAMGGTSGPLYAVFFLRAAERLRSGNPGDPNTWGDAWLAGCQAIGELGGAAPGDRTMLDALVPAASAFRESLAAGRASGDAFDAAISAAETGVQATAQMKPRRGRSSYLGERALGHVDPGAEAVVVLLRAVRDHLKFP